MNTIADIIQIAKISEYLCANDIDKKGLYGGGVDLLLPDKIYNIRKSIEWAYNHPISMPATDAIGYITIDDIGNDGDEIFVSVNDPILGVISFGSYVKQSSDTTTTILAASIASVLSGNSYGYVVSSQTNVITIIARPGLGSSIDGNNRLIVTILNYAYLTTESGDLLITEDSNYLTT